MRFARCIAAALAALVVFAPARAGEAPPPRLVVLLVVDQMRADYLDRFAPILDAGLERAAREGTWFLMARHRHAVTATAPGHATLATGCDPARHGVVANVAFDPAKKTFRRVGVDPDVRSLREVPGRRPVGVSPRDLLVDGLGDWLKAARPDAKVVAIAAKGRSAAMLGGRRADLALHGEGQEGGWTTSSWYARENPPFVERLNAEDPAEAWLGKAWETALSDDQAARVGATADDVPYEGRRRFGTSGNSTFPHRIDSQDDLAFTPFADARTLAAARAAIEALELGRDEVPDLLAVSLAASDMIGHAYGPDSREIAEYYRWLDGALPEFLDALDGAAGAGNWLLVLSADHGVGPIAESQLALGRGGGRVAQPRLRGAVERALDERFGEADWVIEATPDVYLDPAALAARGVQPREAQDVAARALRELPGVQDAYPRHRLEAGDPLIPAPFLRSFHPERSGDVVPHLRAHYYPDYLDTTDYVKANHSTHYDYDQRVPVVFLGAGVRAEARADPFETVDVAPTIARLLGVPAPEVDGVAREIRRAGHER